MGISHLAFVDDIMIFSRGDAISIGVIMQTLYHFENATGIKINISKSKLFTTGISDSETASLQHITKFLLGEFPIKYLGVPLTHGKHKASLFAPLIDKIFGFISSWATSALSYVGRL